MKTRSIFQSVRFILAAVLLPGLAAGFARPASAAALRCYVKWDAAGSNTGDSWANAYKSLQSALGPSPCTQVWVARGTYKPTGGTNRAISFRLKNGVSLYGGFAGTETFLSQRSVAANPTILSGEIGAAGNADNTYHVLMGGETDHTARLDGFTVTAGYANGPADADQYGGGMYNPSSSPTLVNITFRENRALFYGGGMYNFAGSSPSLTNVTFSGNITEDEFGGGGGIFNDASSPSLNHVFFRDNWSRYGGGMRNINGSNPTLSNATFNRNHSHAGGGIYNRLSSPSLINVAFIDNGGGGMINENASSPSLVNATFSGNSSYEWGGGMINYYHSNASLTNVTFTNNSAPEAGGGMYNSNSNPTLVNVTFSGNSVDSWGWGGGMHNFSSSPILTNVTFSGNTADDQFGGAIYNRGQSNPILTNSILYGDPGGEIINEASSPVVSYSIIQGSYPGTGNLDADPLLQPLGRYGGFTRTMPLGSGSPAVDRGTDSGCPAKDQRGVSRPRDGDGDGTAVCDMGATESRLVAKSFASAGAQDGWVLESTETSSAGGTMNAAGAALRVGDDAQDRQYRSLVSFDTAALPDHAVIASASLKLKAAGLVGTNPFTTHMGLKVDIRQPYFGAGAALATGDFQAPAGAAAVGTFNPMPSADAWYSAVLGSAAFPQVNRAGTTQLRLRFLKDDDDNLQADYIKFYSGDYALDPSFRPQLIVRYYLP